MKHLNWMVLALVGLSFILRIWQLPEVMIFTLDEELEAFIVKNIVTGFHYPAIGVSVAPIGLHLSPVFYYLAAIPFGLGQLNPLAWGYTAVFIGLISTWLIYKFTRQMFNENVALISTLLYSSSFLMVMYDKHFWNLTPIVLVSLLTVYSVYKIIKGSNKWFLVLGAALGLGLSSHLSVVSLFVFTLIAMWKYKVSLKNRYSLQAVLIFFLSQFPLLIFELRHSFQQSKVLLNFLSGEQSTFNLQRIWENLLLLPKVYSRLLYTFGSHDYAQEHNYGAVEVGLRDARIPELWLWLVIAMLLAGGIILWKRRNQIGESLQLILLVSTVASLIIYGLLFKGTLFEFYLSLLFPTLFIMTGVLVEHLSKYKSIGKVVLSGILILVVTNIFATFNSTNSYGFSRKLEVINWVNQELKQKPYELHSIGYDHKFEGYRYLFERFGYSPVKSYADAQLGWLYQSSIDPKSAEVMVVVSSFEPAYLVEMQKERSLYTPNIISQNQFGQINVMLVAPAHLSGLLSNER